MSRFWKSCVMIVALVSVLTFAGCGKTVIQKILDKPDEWNGKDVEVSGKVGRALDWGFTLNDGKGEIAVIPKAASPTQGKKVRVKGTVKASYRHTYGANKVMEFPVAIIEK